MKGLTVARKKRNRSQAIRDYLAIDPAAGPAKIMAELKKKGVEFTKPVEDHGYGLVTFFKVPGDFEVQLYQPKYEKK